VVAGGAILLATLVLIVPIARIRSARRRSLPRILWAPTPIINIRYTALGDRLRGYESETLVYDVYRINSRADFDHVVELARQPAPARLVLPYLLLAWALLRYDLFGFFLEGGLLGGTPLWRVELPLAKLAGKRVVAYPYGSDGRIASETRKLGKWNAYTEIPIGAEDRDEQAVCARIRVFGRWADALLGCADLVEHFPRLDGVYLYPLDVSVWTPVDDEVDDGIVTIVHSPNHRHYKGTRYLIDAVAALRREGLPIELTLVEGMSNAEAKQVYERADIVADQFLIGAYALFAIEGMALGKPVVCYLNDHFRPWHPEWAECPIVSANPDELEEALRRLVTDSALRRSLGARGPDYVRRYHSLEAVGERMDAIYRRVWFRSTKGDRAVPAGAAA
jgi:glycosyltransferase involved in cell wall biosynthesis